MNVRAGQDLCQCESQHRQPSSDPMPQGALAEWGGCVC